MRFCSICESKLTKVPKPDGTIWFQCRCGRVEAGGKDDALIDMIYPNTGKKKTAVSEDYSIILSNSLDDEACNRVERKCPDCGIPVMVRVQLGVNKKTVYLCDCSPGKVYT